LVRGLGNGGGIIATEAIRRERKAMELKDGEVKEEGLDPGAEGWTLSWRNNVSRVVTAICMNFAL
jgi:hypothetical protein